ncbi:MAG: helix-turn-helix transcriptional regulator [Oscillospiraceae bacterium]|nr:helix-turn-helix transcriptional regulator [Oscillospiraceae bacterium]MBO7726974.1 helix-turn-helix transcriptional regulator [Oscillospiraceae bacterium]
MYQRYVDLLEKHNTTTYQVCKETGVAQSTISMWKTRAEKDDKATIGIFDLKKIADYFNVSVDYFLT